MADSVHHAILIAVRDGIRSLGLGGIDNQNVAALTVPVDARFYLGDLPVILVSPFGVETIVPTEGTVAKDDIGYPAFVAMIDSANQDQTSDLELWLTWREKIIDNFVHSRQTLTHSVTGIHQFDVTIEPGPIVDPEAWFQRNRFESTLTLRFMVRRQRRP